MASLGWKGLSMRCASRGIHCQFPGDPFKHFCHGDFEVYSPFNNNNNNNVLIKVTVGARFPAPVQTGPDAHPASYTMG
jgi:hypothetical protein